VSSLLGLLCRAAAYRGPAVPASRRLVLLSLWSYQVTRLGFPVVSQLSSLNYSRDYLVFSTHG